jgi:hypothetical protein
MIHCCCCQLMLLVLLAVLQNSGSAVAELGHEQVLV